MDRRKKYNRYKIYETCTAKVAFTSWLDSFAIEKVKFSITEFSTGKKIAVYLDFSDLVTLAADVESGRFFKKVDAAGEKNTNVMLGIGGSDSGALESGTGVSRTISVTKNKTKEGSLYVNLSSCDAKIGPKGLTMPTGANKVSLGICMSYAEFRKMIMYSNACATAFLTSLMTSLVRENLTAKAEYDKKNK